MVEGPDSLHLDAWGELNYADGYDIMVVPKDSCNQAAEEADKLFFLNLGGYDRQQFTELHHNVFIVAKDTLAAKIKAKQQISHWTLPHTYNNLIVDNVIEVGSSLDNSAYQVQLIPTNQAKPFQFTCNYVPIAKSQVQPEATPA